MQWESLTAPEFAKAVRETGVCVFAMGICEKHSEHLPVGTDFLVVHKLACLAAEKEPAVVFPPWYFGQIYEAQCHPGAVSIGPELLLRLLEGVFDEIGRNGFRKIIIYNGHGGNRFLVPFVAQCTLHRPKPYSLYLPERLTPERQKESDSLLDTDVHMHACECETSMSLALHGELVKMDAVSEKPGMALERMTELPRVFAGISWYADFPDHYAGDAAAATAEKGRKLVELRVDSLAEQIAAVKADKVVPALEAEFFERVKKQADK